MIVHWLTAAQQDLEALVDYIAEDNPKTALDIFNTIKKSIKRLQSYPLLGREGRVEKTKELIIPGLPYIVVYSVSKEIIILALLHTSRKWPGEFSQ